MQFISNVKNLNSNTVQDLKDFNSQSSATTAKEESKYFLCFLPFKPTFDLMSDDIV